MSKPIEKGTGRQCPPGYHRLTINIPQELMEQIRKVAESNKATITLVTRTALEEVVAEWQNQ